MLTSIKTVNGDKIMTTKMINYDNKTILKNELLNNTAKRIQWFYLLHVKYLIQNLPVSKNWFETVLFNLVT